MLTEKILFPGMVKDHTFPLFFLEPLPYQATLAFAASFQCTTLYYTLIQVIIPHFISKDVAVQKSHTVNTTFDRECNE